MERLQIAVTGVTAANRLYNNASNTMIHRRCRNRWAVALKRTGKTYYNCNGKTILSDAHHPVILPKGCSYSWTCVESGECLIIEFDVNQELPEILAFSVSDASFFENAFMEIQRDLHIHTIQAYLNCLHRMYGLLLQLVRSAEKEYRPKEKQKVLQPAVEHMIAHYYDPGITNDRLAKLCGISTVYFRKCFQAVYRVSPIRYLHDLRIQRAKDILSSDYSSISQVAESVGFSSVYHFSKMFKLYTGTSPTQYAKGADEKTGG